MAWGEEESSVPEAQLEASRRKPRSYPVARHTYIINDNIVRQGPSSRGLLRLERRGLGAELRLCRSLEHIANHGVVLSSTHTHLMGLTGLNPHIIATGHSLSALFRILANNTHVALDLRRDHTAPLSRRGAAVTSRELNDENNVGTEA